MKKKNVIFNEEVYDANTIAGSLMRYLKQELLPYVSYRTMDDLMQNCDIEFVEYGYVHDTGFSIVITEHGELRHGIGWDNVDTRYSEMVAYAERLWQIAVDYAYHGP